MKKYRLGIIIMCTMMVFISSGLVSASDYAPKIKCRVIEKEAFDKLKEGGGSNVTGHNGTKERCLEMLDECVDELRQKQTIEPQKIRNAPDCDMDSEHNILKSEYKIYGPVSSIRIPYEMGIYLIKVYKNFGEDDMCQMTLAVYPAKKMKVPLLGGMTREDWVDQTIGKLVSRAHDLELSNKMELKNMTIREMQTLIDETSDKDEKEDLKVLINHNVVLVKEMGSWEPFKKDSVLIIQRKLPTQRLMQKLDDDDSSSSKPEYKVPTMRPLQKYEK